MQRVELNFELSRHLMTMFTLRIHAGMWNELQRFCSNNKGYIYSNFRNFSHPCNISILIPYTCHICVTNMIKTPSPALEYRIQSLQKNLAFLVLFWLFSDFFRCISVTRNNTKTQKVAKIGLCDEEIFI